MDYRVALDIYRGPLDLLLYLIQENEVEVTDIPISKITEQYLAHLDIIKELDPNAAGDFLVMASTLMEIKSRLLLPRPERAEGETEEGDPRIELIRQLMEYKKFKEAAALLADRREEHLERFGRGSKQTFGEDADADAVDMSEVSIWDILSAFDRIMRETMRASPATIVNRDVPLRSHIEKILRMLRVQGAITFRSIFETCEDRLEAIGGLLACLEMTRWRVIRLEQLASAGTITVRLADEGEENVVKLMNALSAHPDLTQSAPMESKSARASHDAAPASEELAAPAAEAVPAPEEVPAPVENEIREAPEAVIEEPSEPEPEPVPIDLAPDDEDPDDDLDKIRSIEIHDVDLGEHATKAAAEDAPAEPAPEPPRPAEPEPKDEKPAEEKPA